MAYTVMAHIVMAYIVMAYAVKARPCHTMLPCAIVEQVGMIAHGGLECALQARLRKHAITILGHNYIRP